MSKGAASISIILAAVFGFFIGIVAGGKWTGTEGTQASAAAEDSTGGVRHLLEHVAEVKRFRGWRGLSNTLLVAVVAKRSRIPSQRNRFR